MTRVTPYKTWAAFEEEASYLWKNAWHYNEDGSEIFVLATKLKVCKAGYKPRCRLTGKGCVLQVLQRSQEGSPRACWAKNQIEVT